MSYLWGTYDRHVLLGKKCNSISMGRTSDKAFLWGELVTEHVLWGELVTEHILWGELVTEHVLLEKHL